MSSDDSSHENRLRHLPMVTYLFGMGFGVVATIPPAEPTFGGTMNAIWELFLFAGIFTGISSFLMFWLRPNMKRAVKADVEETLWDRFDRIGVLSIGLAWVIFTLQLTPEEPSMVWYALGGVVATSVIWAVLYTASREPYYEENGGGAGV